MIYTIPAKPSNSGSIHDVASEHGDRLIKFAPGAKFAVILASYYGGKGYTTHTTEATALAAARKVKGYSHIIIDPAGNKYIAASDQLIRA